MIERIAILVLVVGSSLALAGCGGDDAGTVVEHVTVLRVIDVHETEYSLSPKSIKIDRFGYYGIKAINDGNEPHVLAIDGQGVKKQTKEIAAGESETMLVRFSKAGTYRLYCPVDAHEQKGMKAILRVH